MRHTVLVCVLVALAAASVATTVAKTQLCLFLRLYVTRRSWWGGYFIRCPYCLCHWCVFAGVAAYRPRLLHVVAVPDYAVTVLATIAVATATTGVLCRLFSWSANGS